MESKVLKAGIVIFSLLVSAAAITHTLTGKVFLLF